MSIIEGVICSESMRLDGGAPGLRDKPDSSQEDVAGQSFFVPHGELQADVVEVSRLQAAVGEGVVPLRVHGMYFNTTVSSPL
ncbi:hypothetical protein EYF80_028865 [Liparis tanakae]|uniref:Uncharacterized protein n=1 Tax=Liparis tanakae TaxID=230148 RepID=A0A4Z2H5T7_9TELE|nr:hypothetical protein EYF80_028865 [Liparis tanakae]